jgi:hypothetical protein
MTERRRREWEDNINMDIKERVCENVDWIHPFKIGSSGGSCEHGNCSSDCINVGEFIDQLSDHSFPKKI